MEKQKQIGEYIVHFASVFPAQEAYDFSASLLWVDSSSCFCRGAAGNPRVPRLLPGTLGNLPGCL